MTVETIADAVTELHRLATDVESAFCSFPTSDHAVKSILIEAVHYAQVGERQPNLSERIKAQNSAQKVGPVNHLLVAARYLVSAAEWERAKIVEGGSHSTLRNFASLVKLADQSLADFYAATESTANA